MATVTDLFLLSAEIKDLQCKTPYANIEPVASKHHAKQLIYKGKT